MDLEDHLKKLESFSESLGGGYHGVKGMGKALPWSDDKGDIPAWYPAAQDAILFLNESGARVHVEEIRDGAKGPILGLRIRSFDADGLSVHLSRLGTAKGVADWVEKGVSLGAVSVRGERVFLVVEPAHVKQSSIGSSARERGVDATGTISLAAQTVMISESSSTLEALSQARESGGGQLLQFRGDLAQEERNILQEAPESESKFGRFGRGKSKTQALTTAGELGGAPRFVVTGEAVELVDGRYFPVQAVDATSRAVLTRMGATGVKVGRGGQRMLVRAEATEPLEGGSSLEAPEPMSEAGDGAGASRNTQVSLAYRLLHGLSLAPGEGEPLDAGVASRMERFFGESFADVRIHTGRIATEVTDALSVEAVSMGTHVVIPEGLLRSASGEGERVLVHELAHVRQHTRKEEGGRSQKEFAADSAVNRFLAGRGAASVENAEMALRPVAPPPSGADAMPGGVYASARRMKKPEVRAKSTRPPELRTDANISKITREVSRQNVRSREDMFDRQG